MILQLAATLPALLAGSPDPGPPDPSAVSPSGAAGLHGGPPAVTAHDTTAAPEAAVRFFFVSDIHSDHAVVERLIEDTAREGPALVLEGGDFVHDGTWPEFRRAYQDRERLAVPWYLAKGNHDAQRTGPFPAAPPPIPDFQAFSQGGVRFIVLDNHGQGLGEEQFERLEAELEAHDGHPIVVAMHVPPFLSREPALTRLRHVLPLHLPSPTMSDPAEVERFTRLMSEHDVLAVLSGHAHFHDDLTVDGVRYLAAGTAGGMTPGLGIPREYLDVRVEGRGLYVRRVELQAPARDPLTFGARTFRFIAGVNEFSRSELGWSFVPTTSVQWRTGVRHTTARGGGHVAWVANASMADVLGDPGRRSIFADVGLAVAGREVTAAFSAGSRFRPIGGFNRSLFVSAAPTVNVGRLRGGATAGAGMSGEVGVEWQRLTVALGGGWATNRRSVSLLLGRRF